MKRVKKDVSWLKVLYVKSHVAVKDSMVLKWAKRDECREGESFYYQTIISSKVCQTNLDRYPLHAFWNVLWLSFLFFVIFKKFTAFIPHLLTVCCTCIVLMIPKTLIHRMSYIYILYGCYINIMYLLFRS